MPRRKRPSPTPPFRSHFEEDVANCLRADGISFKYEDIQLEYTEPLRKNRAKCKDCGSTNLVRSGWYMPDFILENGVIIEAKGRFTAANRRKMLSVIELHPDETIVMQFMRNNRIHKQSNTTYADWCMQHHIDYTVGPQPKKEWYK